MTAFTKWDSQPIDEWSKLHAKGKFIDLSGRSTHYIEKGEGSPVILLHGFFYDSFMWDKNIDALSKKFKVYALDLWGFGYSTRELLDYGYPIYAEQVLLFMDNLGIEKASLVGQSMGGGTALWFCVHNRQRVDKLLLVDCSCMPHSLPMTGKFFNLPGVGEFMLGLSTNMIRRKNLGDIFIHDKKLLTDDYIENATRFQKVQGTTTCFMKILRKEFFHTLSEEIKELAKLDVPVMIVWGKQDKGIPVAKSEEMHSILKGSRLEILDGAGHVPNFEKAEEFNKLALEFL